MKTNLFTYTIFLFGILVANAENLQLLKPENKTNFVPNNQISLEWILESDEKITYDLFFGTESSPELYSANLDPSINGLINATEFVATGTIYNGGEIISTGIYIANTPLNKNTTYYWKIIAKNENGIVSTSEIFSFTTIRDNNLPSVPQLVLPNDNASDINTTPTLSWTESIDADGDNVTYTIYIKEGLDSFKSIATITETSYTLPFQLLDDVLYSWRIVANDGYLGNVNSNTFSFTVENYANDAPVLGNILKPNDGDTNLGFTINFSWEKAEDSDEDRIVYDVYAAKNLDPQTLIASNITATAITHTFNSYGTIYWKIVAKDTYGNKVTSPVYHFSCWEKAPTTNVAMIDVASGNFIMGQSDVTQIFIRYSINGEPLYTDVSDENPAHQVNLRAYQIGKYEVTNLQYLNFLNANKEDISIEFSENNVHSIHAFRYKRASFKGIPLCQIFDQTRDLSERNGIPYEPKFDAPILWNGTSFELNPDFNNHPIRWMYYTGAKYFAQWLGGYRLPIEAEWEFAALGGNASNNYTYSGSNNLLDVAVSSSTQPVGTKLPNELGVYDMSGNVNEICEDLYNKIFYENSTIDNPVSSVEFPAFSGHVTRGGSIIISTEPYFRVKRRDYLNYEQYMENAGFRLAKSMYYPVSGRIIDESGNPLSNVIVTGFPNFISTDSNGEFSTTVLGGWSGNITAYKQDYSSNVESIELQNIYDTSENNDFILTKKQTNFTLSIAVNDGEIPLENAQITIDGIEYISDINGMLIIENLTTGHYSYTANKIGYAPISGTIVITNSNTTKTITFLNRTLNTEEFEPLETIQIYPNPSTGSFFVNYNGIATVEVYNTLGQKIYTNEIKETPLNITTNSKGVFYVVVKNKKSKTVRKVIIK